MSCDFKFLGGAYDIIRILTGIYGGTGGTTLDFRFLFAMVFAFSSFSTFIRLLYALPMPGFRCLFACRG